MLLKQYFWVLLLLAAPAGLAAEEGPLVLQSGDHISIIGNTLADRMQHDGFLEARLQARFPQHQLTIRNLGFSGDELTVRLRSADFGSPDDFLRKNETGVVFAFFGYNESFADAAGLEKFRADLKATVEHMAAQKYDGKGGPRIVLFTPIAHEDLHDRNLPDGKENNRRLKLYSDAILETAKQLGVAAVDLFTPSAELYESQSDPLTINGVHLNEHGNKLIAAVIERALFGARAGADDEQRPEKIRAAVLDKNFYWFERYRTVDGYSIYGGRSHLAFVDGQTNREVAMRELEMLDVMTANRDKRIWAVANGGDLKVDDSNAPPSIPVKTNKPGPLPGGKHLFLGGEAAIEKMTVGAGLKVNLFATEEDFPELASPVQMAFDVRGRLWVAAWPTYPHWHPKEEMNDKLLIFEDVDGDGKADQCKTFADGLHCPTGFEFWGGGVLVAQAPDIMFLKDVDGDDKADVRTRVLHGLDSADTHHTSNSFTIGPGGALYFQEGTFHHTQVETPYGPTVRSVNAGVFRYEPRSQKFEVYVPYRFANPHGHSFDRWGQDFITDGTTNENYYAAAFSGHLDHPNKHDKGMRIFQQRIRPAAATEIVSSRHFPDSFQGDYLIANVIGFQGILRYRLDDDGAGFAGTEVEPIVFSSDPNFRPVDMEFGPDGALYFVDWQNPIIGHMQHNLRDPSRDKVHGRVYRVSCPERPLLEPPKIAGQSVDDLLDLLKTNEYRVRYRAKIELSDRDSDEVVAAVDRWVAALDKNDPDVEHQRLEALWVKQHHNVVDESLLDRMLHSPDPRARAAAVRVLCYWRDRIGDPVGRLAQAAVDEHPRVRLEAIRACSFISDVRSVDAALLSLQKPSDRFLKYTLHETMKQLEPIWKKALADRAPIAVDNPAGADYLLSNVSTRDLLKGPPSEAALQAVLARSDALHEDRYTVLGELARLHQSSATAELVAAVERIDRGASSGDDRVLYDFAHMLARESRETLSPHRSAIEKLAGKGRRAMTRRIALSTLVALDQSVDPTWDRYGKTVGALEDLVEMTRLISDAKLRAACHARISPLIEGLPAELASDDDQRQTAGRFVRIELPGGRRTLTLAEVEVYSEGRNVARAGKARQSSVAFGGNAQRAIDGNTNGNYSSGAQTHTVEDRPNPWWEVELPRATTIDSVAVFNRSEGDGRFADRLEGFTLQVLDADRNVVFEKKRIEAPAESVRLDVAGHSPASRVRRAAIGAIVLTGVEQKETFARLASLLEQDKDRAAAVEALGRLPRDAWTDERLPGMVDSSIAHLRAMSPTERTGDAAMAEMELAKNFAVNLPKEAAASARKALGELGVNVVRVRPVPHLMLYDRTDVYVEADKPVEIIFENVDVMPHNLVIARPGSLAKVGLAGEAMIAQADAFSRHFVPRISEVLRATRLLQPGETQRLSFTAPKDLGEYPYICTFPGHWQRMHGVMHVVKDLSEVPAEALAPSTGAGQTASRPHVKNWTLDHLLDHLAEADRGRSFSRGQALFQEMSCIRCHQLNGDGGKVGPDLTAIKDKLARSEMKRIDVLREIIEPSARIDEKFKSVTIIDSDGQVHSGLLRKDGDVIELVPSPLESKDPIVIDKDDVVDRIDSKASLMPQGIVNTMTLGEILDLLMYVESAGKADHPAFGEK